MFVTLANTTASRRVERSPPFHPARSTCMVYRGTSLIINRAPQDPTARAEGKVMFMTLANTTASMEPGGEEGRAVRALQGYLAHKKPQPRRTLQ